ncbi:hypothetical protein [Neorhizobium sp. LjRoot104]
MPLILVSWLSMISNEILAAFVPSFILLSVTVSITIVAGYYIKRRY